ncbi:hypothetical protein P9853_12190, partial [Geobacillus stearothermophilus]|uniref:hypothetical protein n=1 Tax=Geobacillus stearothermophilus TaxID=1422 RepID=UPI002E1E87B0|nr:hypothetical protein [Geobacillus stearothermophilus]
RTRGPDGCTLGTPFCALPSFFCTVFTMPLHPLPVLAVVAALAAVFCNSGSPDGDGTPVGGGPRENKRASRPPAPPGRGNGAGMRANGADGAPMNGEGIIGGRLYLMALMTVASFPLCG